MSAKENPGTGGTVNRGSKVDDFSAVSSNLGEALPVVNAETLGGQGRPVEGAACGPSAGRSALPCLYSNNSIEKPTKQDEGSFNRPVLNLENLEPGADPLPVDRHGREWNGTQWSETASFRNRALRAAHEDGGYSVAFSFDDWAATITPAERKKAHTLFENTHYLIERNGLEKVGFLTLTFPDNVTDFKEANRRFNSLRTNFLSREFSDWLVVVEPQKRGSLHYHLLVVCAEDIRTGFDFEAVNRGDYSSASPYLKATWRNLRKALPGYGFGRSELKPVKTTIEAAARYVGKYIGKGGRYRGEDYKGARMVRYSHGWRCCSSRFSWVDSGREWRAFVGSVARFAAVSDIEGMTEAFGSMWAFKLLKLLEHDSEVSPVYAAAFLSWGRRSEASDA